MDYVFDSSFIGAIIIPDEKNPNVDKVRKGIGEKEEIFIPHLLWYEITNVFMNLIRRRRFTEAEVLRFYPRLDAIDFTCDYAAGIDYSQKLLRLCGDYRLSSYDAAYLELAERKEATLCTLDEGLRLAAKKHGVTVIK